MSLGVLVDCDVEAKDDGELGRALEHGRTAHDVLLVHRADVDAGDGDLDRVRLEELEQSLERTESRRLDKHTASARVDRVEEVRQIRHDLLAELVLVVVLAADEQARTSDRLLEVGRDDLDTHRSLDLLVVDVLALQAWGKSGQQEHERTRRDCYLP